LQTTETSLQHPYLVAWLNDDQAFIGGRDSFAILDTVNNAVIKQTERERVYAPYDIAVNSTKTQYAVSFYGSLHCYNTHDHGLLWKYQYVTDRHAFPITFNSQNENQVIYGISAAHIVASTLSNNDDENRLYFHCSSGRTISCKSSETKVIFYNYTTGPEGFEVYTTTKDNYHSHPCFNKTKPDQQQNNFIALTEIRYTPNGKHIILNFQHALQIHNADLQNLGSNNDNIITIRTDRPCIAFECYNDLFIAVLTQDNIVSYYNYYSTDPITQTSLQHLVGYNPYSGSYKRLSISSDGSKPLAALCGKCFVIPVPLLAIVCDRPETAQLIHLLLCVTKAKSTICKRKADK